MAKPSFSEFRDKKTGAPTFTDGSARERLHATLNSGLTSGPTREQQRAEATAKARGAVDAGWPGAKMGAAVNRVLVAGKAHVDATAQARADMRQDRFPLWQATADENFAQYLLDETTQFAGIVESARGRTPKAARPFPVTSVDVASLAIRLDQLDSATPAEAQGQIEDGIQREDVPYLVAAAANLRSWPAYRNSWMGHEAQGIANGLLDQIDATTWTPANDAAEYAEERAAASIRAWTLLVGLVQNTPDQIPTYVSTGALAPLIEQSPGADARLAKVSAFIIPPERR